MVRKKRREKSRDKKKSRDSGKGSKRFSYNRTAESVKRRAEQSGGNRDGFIKDEFKVFKPGEHNHIRILPPTWEDADHFAFDAFVNYGIGPDNSQFLSLSRMKDEDDPIAEERKNAEREGDIDYAESLKPTKRPTCYVIDRNAEDEGVMVYPMPWTLDRDIAALMIHKRSGEVIPIDDPEEGFDVFFDKTGTGMKTRYIGVEIDRDDSPIFEDADDLDEILEWLEENPLPECLNFYDYEYISKVFDAETAKAKSAKDSDGEEEEEEEGDNYSWDEVHDLRLRKLENLVEDEDLNLDSDDYDELEEFADAICEELDIEKPRKKKKRERKSGSDKKRMKKMRKRRRD